MREQRERADSLEQRVRAQLLQQAQAFERKLSELSVSLG